MNESQAWTIAPLRTRTERRRPPRVSVVMITYNHEPYIAQAIESVLDQETDFPVELIIGEDASTDGTRAIVQEYAERYPAVVSLLPAAPNMGMHANFRRTYESANGQYVALLEGDDYWLNPDKLAHQLLQLEAHPDATLCYHQAVTGEQIDYPAQGEQLRKGEVAWPELNVAPINFENLVGNICIPTAAAFFRSTGMPKIPTWVDLLPWCDWAVYLLLLARGPAVFVPKPWSLYRRHPGGISRTINSYHYSQGAVRTYLYASGIVIGKRRRLCLDAAAGFAIAYADTPVGQGEERHFVSKLLLECMARSLSNPAIFYRLSINLLKIVAPGIYALLRRIRHRAQQS